MADLSRRTSSGCVISALQCITGTDAFICTDCTLYTRGAICTMVEVILKILARRTLRLPEGLWQDMGLKVGEYVAVDVRRVKASEVD